MLELDNSVNFLLVVLVYSTAVIPSIFLLVCILSCLVGSSTYRTPSRQGIALGKDGLTSRRSVIAQYVICFKEPKQENVGRTSKR